MNGGRPRDESSHWPKVLALCVFLLALWAQPAALVGAFYDDGIYVALAKALASGEGYRYAHLPGSLPSVHYPPLYPFALSLLWRVWPAFPANVVLFQVFDAAALAVGAWILAAQARRFGAPGVTQYLFIPAAFASFPLLSVVGVRFSEPMFLALAGAAIWFADRERPGVRDAVLAGAFAGLATLSRSIGIAAIAGVVAALWLRRSRREAVVALVVAGVLVAPWFAWVAAHAHEIDPRIAANYGSYATEVRQAGAGGVLAGLDLRALGPPAALAVAVQTPWIRYPLNLLLLVLSVWGGVTVARRAPALVATVIAYVGVVSLWPYAPDRFMWIVVPWLAALLASGMAVAWDRGPVARWAVLVAAVAMGAGYLPREASMLAHRRFANAAEAASVPIRVLAPAISAGLPAGAIIASEAEAGVYLYGARRAVPSSLFRWEGRGTVPLGPDSTIGYFCDAGVTHFALSNRTGEAARTARYLREHHPVALRPLFEISSGPALYEFTCPR